MTYYLCTPKRIFTHLCLFTLLLSSRYYVLMLIGNIKVDTGGKFRFVMNIAVNMVAMAQYKLILRQDAARFHGIVLDPFLTAFDATSN